MKGLLSKGVLLTLIASWLVPIQVRGQEALPEYYQEVISYLADNYDQVLAGGEGLDPKYVPESYTSQGGVDHLSYALYDVDMNGVPELFVGPGAAIAVYTYAQDDVHLIADYSQTMYITNRGNIDIYDTGRVFGSLSGGALTGISYELAFNEDKTAWVKIHEYEHNFQENPDQPYLDVQSGQRMTEDEYQALRESEDHRVDPSTWNWTPIKEARINAEPESGQSVSSISSQEASPTDPETSSQDLTAYLEQLRQANDRWASRLNQLLESGLPAASDLVPANPSAEGRHQAIQALYQAFNEAYASYPGDSPYLVPFRELYSDTFVLEKILLPELQAEDLDALDQLREWLTSIVYEGYQDRSTDGFVTSGFAMDTLDFAKQLADVAGMSDEVFDQSNRIAIQTGIASEAYNTTINGDTPWMASVPFEGHWFSHMVNPHSADVGSTRIQAYQVESDQVWQGIPLAGPVEPVTPVNYQDRYGTEIKNYYPAGPVATSSSVATSSQDPEASSSSTWSTQKAQALASQVRAWGGEMGQSYQEYSPGQEVDFYGAHLPNESFAINLDGQTRQAHYQSEGDLVVLAVYSDIEDTANPLEERHLYLFAEDQGKPRVLIAVNGPDSQGNLSFKDTANQDLRNRFLSVYN
ncbi:DUF4767 domain-containing protein [Hutsoniella sourekii]